MAGNIEHELMALSPVDGRYAGKVEELAPVFSEYGLVRARLGVEAGWLAVMGSGVLPGVDGFSARSRDAISGLVDDFDVGDAARIKEIEKTTNHDVKAVETWMREKLADDPELASKLELIHFGLTSEDVNNLAYATMHKEARDEVLLPALGTVEQILYERAERYADMPLLARTHGQPATPTTLGHEMNVFAHRLSGINQDVGGVAILGKLNGATGGFAAHAVAYPEVNWPNVSRQFVGSLGLTPNEVTTQIEPHDWNARLYYAIAHGNNVMTDLATDMWQYISAGHFAQKLIAGEVGSSAMPHKINPIDFENAEANFGLANGTLIHLAGKLTMARLQRDLSDSAAQRAIGGAFGHTLIGYKAVSRAFGRAEANPANMLAELDSEWSVLAEAAQTVMRRYRVDGAYDIIKAATRGKPLDEETYAQLVMSIEGIPDDARERLLELTPASYTGYAAELARQQEGKM